MKCCLKCGKVKDLNDFHRDKSKKDGHRPYCKECAYRYFDKNSLKLAIQSKKHYLKNRQNILLKSQENHRLYPWKRVLVHIKQRCNNPHDGAFKNYGGRGIKCLITEKEIKKLWFRDKAYLMKRPTIDRINNNGNYIYDNCRFIELVDNVKRQDKKQFYKKVLQFDREGNFIKEWENVAIAGAMLNINRHNIGSVARKLKNHNTAGGFIWKYKEINNASKNISRVK